MTISDQERLALRDAIDGELDPWKYGSTAISRLKKAKLIEPVVHEWKDPNGKIRRATVYRATDAGREAIGVRDNPTRSAISRGLPRFPTFLANTVCHVGNLSVSRKLSSSSYEGPGLSVSLYPEEWAQIAKLGGDTYALSRIDGRPGTFVDMLKVDARSMRDSLTRLLVERGLVTREKRWYVRFTDEDRKRTIGDFKTPEDANVEAESMDVHDVVVKSHTTAAATPALLRYWNQFFTDAEPVDAFDVGLNYLVNEEGRYDGLWWHEDLDVFALSAPRGVIVPSKIKQWRHRKTDACGGENPLSHAGKIIAIGLGFGTFAVASVAAIVYASERIAAVKKKLARVALLGDSLAVGLGPEIAKLAKADGVDFRYFGRSGTTSKQWVDNRWADPAVAFAPDVFLVSLGANDFGYSPAPPRAAYEQLRDQLRATGARVVWIEPLGTKMNGPKSVIESLGVDVVPPDKSVPLASDGVHAQRYDSWARTVYSHIKDRA
jgi:hypothetical protein